MVNRVPRATDSEGLLLGDLVPGSRVGEYTIEHRLPSFGTGHIYAATHRVLPRRVTIKIIPAAQPWAQPIARELLREACIVDALDHPGVPRVYETGMLADRRPWTATELVQGPTLATIATRRAVAARDIAAIVRDVAAILDHAHGRGLVHRNVTPAAIVIPDVARRFPLCLTSWGGARTHDATTPLPLRGTPYTAPEQHRDEQLDGRADVYSLGVIAGDLLRRACPGTAPPVFAALVDRMISLQPSHRPTAREVVELATWLAMEIEPEHAIPELVDDDGTAPMLMPSRVITSELTPNIAGEIQPGRR